MASMGFMRLIQQHESNFIRFPIAGSTLITYYILEC